VRHGPNVDNLVGHVKVSSWSKEYSNERSAKLNRGIVGISQPTFLPWLGYFSIIDSVDNFVLLDDVPFSRQSWQQRNRVRGPSGLQWLTIPVKTSDLGGQLISETEIDTRSAFPRKQVNTLRQLYGKSRNWDTVGELVTSCLYDAVDHKSLSALNGSLISGVAQWLGITTKLHFASELTSEAGRSEKLASIVAGFEAKTYLSTPGSMDYLLEEKEPFERRGINVEIHQYEHPVYAQRFEPFISHASVVDLIFSPVTDPLEVIRSGRNGSIGISAWETRQDSSNF